MSDSESNLGTSRSSSAPASAMSSKKRQFSDDNLGDADEPLLKKCASSPGPLSRSRSPVPPVSALGPTIESDESSSFGPLDSHGKMVNLNSLQSVSSGGAGDVNQLSQ